MAFEYTANPNGGDGYMDQFYPFTTSPTNTTSPAASPSSALPLTMSPTTMTSHSPGRLSGGVSWTIPFDYAGSVSVIGSTIPSPVEAASSSPENSPQCLSPGHVSSTASSPHQQQLLSPFQTTSSPSSRDMLTEWTLQQHSEQHTGELSHQHLQQASQAQQRSQFPQPLSTHPHQPQTSQDMQPFFQNSALMTFSPFATNFQQSALDYLPAPTTTTALDAGIPLGAAFNPMQTTGAASAAVSTTQAMQWSLGLANWRDFDANIVMPPTHGLPQRLGSMTSLGSNSPTGTCLEVHSLGGSSGDFDWTNVDLFQRYDSFSQPANPQAQGISIFNPGQTLHLRSHSDSSQSDGNSLEIGSYEEISFQPYSPFSQDSDSCIDATGKHRGCFHAENGQAHQHHQSHELVSPAAVVPPVPIKSASSSAPASSSRQSPSAGSGVGSTSSLASGASASSASPPVRRSSGTRKSPISKPTKAVIRRAPSGKDTKIMIEKKVGRRRGPLLPEQRKQASEIRKLRACLRCKFLKKTCDKGEPCAGCQPSHARLWQVPCTRIDIKDVNFFMKDWKADYERHMDRSMSVYNVKGFAQKESLMWITHGYGFCLPITVREVYVADEHCFEVDWVESHYSEQEPTVFGIRTEKLDVGQEGVSMEKLSEYLDRHIDGPFENFIQDHFEGTPFITEILKTVYQYYTKEKLPIIRKALKLVLAYNLTMHITMVEQQGSETSLEGQIDVEESKFYGKVVAPVMINFQIKCAMADMWRELQKEILEELSSLYSSVYSGGRLKNWPSIFMLAAVLLVVWEEMQFDCHYRVQDSAYVERFCADMEGIPVGVVVGLFHAISQKLPAFVDWDTGRHGHLLNNNEAVCEAMTEVRQHVLQHETYLRARQVNTEFDRNDFDSLSNKFLSKLVIRAN